MEADALERNIRTLIDDYRDRCLWFLRADYYPTGLPETLRALRSIEEHGDLEAFRRAAELRQWLSRTSSD